MLARARIASITLALGSFLCHAAWADIYSYTADDGSISLSNVPADDRYTVLISALPQAQSQAAAPPAARPRAARAGRADEYTGLIEQVSRAYGIERALLHAVVSVESSYNPNAVSKKGAIGLMQLMPQTARRYGIADAFDPRQNLDAGARYLRDLLRLFHNDVELALAAYNAGENAVTRHGNRIPPFSETLRYVPQVLDFYRRYQASSARA